MDTETHDYNIHPAKPPVVRKYCDAPEMQEIIDLVETRRLMVLNNVRDQSRLEHFEILKNEIRALYSTPQTDT